LALEIQLFQSLLDNLQPFVPALQQLAYAIGTLDVVHAFARQAIQYQYCRPEINDGFSLELTDSRHPVIERLLPEGSRYVPNDVTLDPETCRLMVLTGTDTVG
jgi:DNA mismatch repair protein MutS